MLLNIPLGLQVQTPYGWLCKPKHRVPDPHPEQHFIPLLLVEDKESLHVQMQSEVTPRHVKASSFSSINPLFALHSAALQQQQLLWLCSLSAQCAAPRALVGSLVYSDKSNSSKQSKTGTVCFLFPCINNMTSHSGGMSVT